MNTDNAAENLEGLILDSGWKVLQKIPKSDNATGSFFSVCYKVEKDGEICFMKALNFLKFLGMSSSRRPIDVIAEMSQAYTYERDLSLMCQNSKVTKVAFVRDSGDQTVSGYTFGYVPYLIFDLADGDVRKKLSISKDIDVAWKLYSLHSIAVGLRQLHSIGVSHQDLKPSNVLVYNEDSKIGDLGRSVSLTISNPYALMDFAGDRSYAQPEILYGYIEPDLVKRTYLADCYLLGSLIVFYFTGISMSALLSTNLEEKFNWEKWGGTFGDVKNYLTQAFSISLTQLRSILLNNTSMLIADEIVDTVKGLCYPIPEQRGHPKNFGKSTNVYDLQRYISKLDLIHKKAKFHAIIGV